MVSRYSPQGVAVLEAVDGQRPVVPQLVNRQTQIVR
jgi:hypothetical protein